MSDNPVVVFVIANSIGLSSEKLPIGWRIDGTRDDVITPSESYSVVLLDDERDIPQDINFANRDADGVLLIVAHNSSNRYTEKRIQQNSVLRLWGEPYVCEMFSRGDGGTWSDIQSLVSGICSANNFVAKRRNRRELELYDRLAAICQIRMIDPTLETGGEPWDTIGMLPQQFRDEIRPLWNRPKPQQPDWPSMLDVIRRYAAVIA